MDFKTDEIKLCEAKLLIVAEPTPINAEHTPDLYPVENASRIVGRNLTKETMDLKFAVYPAVIEDTCVGLAFKVICQDGQNGKVVSIISKVEEYDMKPEMASPWADSQVEKKKYGVEMTRPEDS